MAKYAVIRIGGKQYKVTEGEEILVDKLVEPNLPAQAGKLEAEVLLAVDGDKVQVGKPRVKGVKVSLKVVTEMEKGKKIEVYKFKAKSRYRKHIGFRPQYTSILV